MERIQIEVEVIENMIPGAAQGRLQELSDLQLAGVGGGFADVGLA